MNEKATSKGWLFFEDYGSKQLTLSINFKAKLKWAEVLECNSGCRNNQFKIDANEND